MVRLGQLTILLLLAWHSPRAAAQTDSLTSTTRDQLFRTARDLAFSGKRTAARAVLFQGLAIAPADADMRILLARTYSWDGQYDSARIHLRNVRTASPDNRDALTALVDVELWDGNPAEALTRAEEGLERNPRDSDLLIRKARALRSLNDDDGALAVLDTLEAVDPREAGAAGLRAAILTTRKTTNVGASYSIDRYSAFYDPMHYVSVQYSRRLTPGSFVGRLNFANRFSRSGLQAEVDLYPRIADGMYGYINYGVSGSTLFPRHRLGLELHAGLPMNLEGSAGFRSLWFASSDRVMIYTGSVGWYTGNYWLSLRPYVTPRSNGSSVSLSFSVRRYIGEEDDYISLRCGAGFTPDERLLQADTGSVATKVYSLQSQSAGIGVQYHLSPAWQIVSGIDLARQELAFRPGEYVTLLSLSVGWRWNL